MKNFFFLSASMLIIMLLSAFSLSAQDAVKWSASVQMSSKTEGVIILSADIANGWHLYGFNLPDDGPVSTTISFLVPRSVKWTGKMTMSKAPIKMYDDMFGIDVTFWEGKVVFKRKFKIKGDKPVQATVNVSFMACNDSNCQPPKTESFTLELK